MTHSTITRLAASSLLVASLALAGCGDDTTDTSSSATTTSPASTTSAAGAVTTTTGTAGSASTVQVVDSDYGPILADGDGRTLYLFTPDSAGSSTCNDGCSDTWPPLRGPATADGVTGELGTTTRDDGSVQVTVAGHPLYRYAADTAPGSTAGEVVGGKWYVVDAAGRKVEESATTTASDSGY